MLQSTLCDMISIDKPHNVKDLVHPGDIWQLGNHRIMCGDSTKLNDVSKLLDGHKANLTLTDPPYGVGEAYTTYNDTPEELEKLINGFFPIAKQNSDLILLTPGNKNQYLYPKPSWTLCWFIAAGTGMGPWGFTCWQPILAYGSDPYLKNNLGSRPDGLSLAESADNSLGHPCPKPLKVWSWVLKRGSVREGELIYDPFLGSGTTLLISEKYNRICYGMEINPEYCNIIIKRYEEKTGIMAKLVSTEDHASDIISNFEKEKVKA